MSTPISEPDVAAIKANLQKGVNLALEADWDGFLDLYTDDVVLLPPDQPVVEGKEAARKWIASFPQVNAFDSKITKVDGRDDFAWVWGTYTMTAELEPRKQISMKGKWTGSYRKQADGSWLMASDIWNLDAPMTVE